MQHSRLWQARLEVCQNIIVKFFSHSAGNVNSIKHILRHFGVVVHRLKSATNPRRLYAYLMIAIAMLLADMAGDTRRQAEERKQAEASLEAMTPQHILEVALSGDYADVGTMLLLRGRDLPVPLVLPNTPGP